MVPYLKTFRGSGSEEKERIYADPQHWSHDILEFFVGFCSQCPTGRCLGLDFFFRKFAEIFEKIRPTFTYTRIISQVITCCSKICEKFNFMRINKYRKDSAVFYAESFNFLRTYVPVSYITSFVQKIYDQC